MTLPLGLGVYPAAVLADVLRAVPVGDIPLLVMGRAGCERHDIAATLALRGCSITRRHWEDAGNQVDWNATPEAMADRWYGLILGGINPVLFTSIYKRAVGPNELAANSAPERFGWLNAFEVALCERLHAVGIAYAWGSVAVGNIDPVPFATIFAPINALADAVCYHVYVAPGRSTLESTDNPYYARRPYAWWQECQAKGGRFPPLFGGESGTYGSWKDLGLTGTVYVNLEESISLLFARWKAAGMPVLGHCLFAVGAEGTMGEKWNIGPAELDQIGTFNREQVTVPSPVPAPAVPSAYAVGPGVLAAMALEQDTPATREVYLSADAPWSETVGQSGTVYRYVVSLQRTFVYPPKK